MDKSCGAIFDYPNSSSLCSALKTPMFLCSGCRKLFPTKRGCESHVVGVHLGLEIPCGVDGCHFGPFRQESSYRRHVLGNSEHPSKHINVIQAFISSKSSPPDIIVCCGLSCRDTWTDEREFAHHVMNEHLTRIPCPECAKIGKKWSTNRMPALMEHLYGEHADIMAQYIESN
ncbi:hypothetical protein CPB85DRAFT_165837 [Mucidula mucida]|nr:hypothetical protein CPB85DRAFT_165837 [Mucidula mucida]